MRWKGEEEPGEDKKKNETTPLNVAPFVVFSTLLGLIEEKS